MRILRAFILLCSAAALVGCGSVGVGCPPDESVCGATCKNILIDPANCGACDSPCPSEQVCVSGRCAELKPATVPCATTETMCNGVCANTNTDSQNCGACGNVCSGATVCNGSGQCGIMCSAAKPNACGAGSTAYCTDVKTDPQNCGLCHNVCGAGMVCTNGACASTCGMGQTACPTMAPTYCATLMEDRNNCGACGTVCAAGKICMGGSCVISCPMGQSACPTMTPTYCANLQTSSDDCGMCGNSCALMDQICSNATCCDIGNIGCGGTCFNPDVSVAHCGNCATACPAMQVCITGTCQASKIVFLSSTTTDGNLGGLTGADAFCQNLATMAGLPGTYMAWLSDGTGSPATRFTQALVPYKTLDGMVVAAAWGDLIDGTLMNPINVTEEGVAVVARVWSGTGTNGAVTGSDDCSQWAVTGTNGGTGLSTATNGDWTNDSTTPNDVCTANHHVYCFQQ